MLKWSLQLHKWLALVVGVQVLFWVAGGVVMTAIPIEKVRGEHHKATFQLPPPDLSVAKSPAEVAAAAGLAGASPFLTQPKNRDPNDPSTWGPVARNEACPCGSGKKFKHCHGAFAEA